MIARILFLLAALFLYLYASSPRAATMSDLWWNPNESGWGANIVEQQTLIFILLYVYGPDGRPAWYSGPSTPLVSSSNGQRVYSGALYATNGPWFAAFFNPAAVGVRQVGSVTFTATSYTAGTLTYTVDGVTVSKAIQRFAFKHINLGGTYYGAIDVLNDSACGLTGAALQPFYAMQAITATVSSSGSTGNLTMTATDTAGDSFTFSGSYVQRGSIYQVNGSMTFGGASQPAAIQDFTADDDGIRGNIVLQTVTGCFANIRFAAVRPG